MKTAVLTLTRGRLAYTQHCIQTLRDNAGTPYHHYVFDQGSTDGTARWLDQRDLTVTYSYENIGIWRGLNHLLDRISLSGYDVVVNFDNDCEVTVPDTLRVVAELAQAHPGNVVGPLVNGLNHAPRIHRLGLVDGHTVGTTDVVGGIFMPLPHGWRYPENGSFVHYDNVICQKARQDGCLVGQLIDFPVNHYRTTAQQWLDYPAYFALKAEEGIPL